MRSAFPVFQRLLLLPALALSLHMITPAVAATQAPAPLQAALAAPGRPAADLAADSLRKPVELMAFAGVKPGQHVIELMPGGGYFTRLFSHVVGPEGQVQALVPQPHDQLSERFQTILTEGYAKMQALASERPNVQAISHNLATLQLAESADLVWTAQNYHDISGYWGAEVTAQVNQAIFQALKPGGVYLVIDHTGNSDPTAPTTVHRIDPKQVKQQVLAAGFVLEAESPLLHNPHDDYTVSVFAPELRGHTDQFVLKFRKPQTTH